MNIFNTVNEIARDAAIELADALVVLGIIPRDVEQKMVGKKGGKVQVSVIDEQTANHQDHRNTPTSLTSDDINERHVDVEAYDYFYKRHTLNSKELTYNVDDFTRLVTRPAVRAIARGLEGFHITQMAAGFAPQVFGTVGSPVEASRDIILARKGLKDAHAPMNGIYGILGTQAEANLLQLDEFKSADYADAPTALRQAMLPFRHGVQLLAGTETGGTFDQGDIAGTVLVKGASQTGTSIVVDGFTEATGTVKRGTRLTFAGDSTVYTLAADATIASNEATLVLTQAKASAAADDAAVTFETPFTEDVIFQRNAYAGAIVAPEPLAMGSAVEQFNGLSIRVTVQSSIDGNNGAVDSILYDVYTGGNVLKATHGGIFQKQA